MTENKVVIPRGGRAASDRAAADKESRNKGFNRSVDFLTLKESGDSIVVRFITDEPDFREVLQHSFAPTKSAPADFPKERKWPANKGSVCRQSPGFDAIYDDCYLCGENAPKNDKGNRKRPALRLWALAVEREAIVGTEDDVKEGLIEDWQIGDTISYQDKLIEVEEDGKKVVKKHYLVLNFGLENFFDQFIAIAGVNKTLLNVDYTIVREGTGLDTSYTAAAGAPVLHEDGKAYDLRRKEVRALYADADEIDLDEMIAAQASDRYYGLYFDKTVSVDWKTESDDKSDSKSAKASTPAAEVGPSASDDKDEAEATEAKEKMKALRAKMLAGAKS